MFCFGFFFSSIFICVFFSLFLNAFHTELELCVSLFQLSLDHDQTFCCLVAFDRPRGNILSVLSSKGHERSDGSPSPHGLHVCVESCQWWCEIILS